MPCTAHLNKKRIINFIKWMEKTNTYRFTEISEVLNIEFASLNKLYKKGFSKKEAFNIVWFLKDKVNIKGKLAISNNQVKKFINLYQNKNTSIEYKEGKLNVKSNLLASIIEDECNFDFRDPSVYPEIEKLFDKVIDGEFKSLINLLDDKDL